eukprot:1549486-Rhodomonas_salina.1
MVERKWREGGQNARRGRVRSIPERSIALIGAPSCPHLALTLRVAAAQSSSRLSGIGRERRRRMRYGTDTGFDATRLEMVQSPPRPSIRDLSKGMADARQERGDSLTALAALEPTDIKTRHLSLGIILCNRNALTQLSPFPPPRSCSPPLRLSPSAGGERRASADPDGGHAGEESE